MWFGCVAGPTASIRDSAPRARSGPVGEQKGTAVIGWAIRAVVSAKRGWLSLRKTPIMWRSTTGSGFHRKLVLVRMGNAPTRLMFHTLRRDYQAIAAFNEGEDRGIYELET